MRRARVTSLFFRPHVKDYHSLPLWEHYHKAKFSVRFLKSIKMEKSF